MKVPSRLASVLASATILAANGSSSPNNAALALNNEEVRSYYTTRLDIEEIRKKFQKDPAFSKLTDSDLMSLNQLGRRSANDKMMTPRVKALLKSKETGELAKAIMAEARLNASYGFRLLSEQDKETLRQKEMGKKVDPNKVQEANNSLEKLRDTVDKEVAQDKAKKDIKSEFVCEACGRG